MLDTFLVFTKGGFVLYFKSWNKLKGTPVDHLVNKVLIEERMGSNSFEEGSYTLKWTLANEYDLVFVAVYQNILSLFYIDDLLEAVKKNFCDMFKSNLKIPLSLDVEPSDFKFDEKFDSLFIKAQKKDKKPTVQKTFQQTSLGQEIKSQTKPKKEPKEIEKVETRTPKEIAKSKFEKKTPKAKPKSEKKPAPKKKAARKWDEDDTPTENLDHSTSTEFTVSEEIKRNYMGSEEPGEQSEEEFSEDEEEEEEEVPDKPKKKGFLSSWFSVLTDHALDEEDLKPVIEEFRQHLVAKNVASDIAEKLCQSLLNSLVGTTQKSLTRISSTVKSALEESLTKILTPKQNIDVLRSIQLVRKQRRPFSIVFVGVNGVGKSTSLAKVCSWLLSQKLSVMIAGCDTFRSGAVEQLRVHSQCLGVELYEKGYGKDAAGIAQEALKYAKNKGIDVVLIDTAGRMQDNEPLMKALSKLVHVNSPDLILFVGEALVGNDGVDQLMKFNQSMVDCSTSSSPRTVDGIVLTKFDTIDDKVGAALSMVYSTGQPILFVGVGQQYRDLKAFSVNKIVKLLLQ